MTTFNTEFKNAEFHLSRSLGRKMARGSGFRWMVRTVQLWSVKSVCRWIGGGTRDYYQPGRIIKLQKTNTKANKKNATPVSIIK